MQWLTALFLTVFSLVPFWASAQESVQDWSKKVIELQEKEGQNFDQDLLLAKGYLYLQRRSDALTLLNRLLKGASKKDARIQELFEAACDQFFLQETAEIHADVVQLLKEESWIEAKEKVEAGLQKEPKQRLLILRAIQLSLILPSTDALNENIKTAESNFPDIATWKVYNSWINVTKGDGKEGYRILSALWTSDQKFFEKNEVVILAYLQSLELTKHSADWVQLSKIILRHPEWVSVRMWRLKNKSFAAADKKKEIAHLEEQFRDMKKLKTLHSKEDKESSYYYVGLITAEKAKAQLEEFQAPKPSEKTSGTN